ncbi:hypothetical protein NC653_023837 [Populus alba x Populus x berolinensis]|uniref:Uncharacterized protein n=1 Tax=Populus alba x Populus x berolinensis TaxID=444605 RepID=A0AAD6MIW3_9ROSI|nr:hypothetical protein NC653_023837 [Populus alba x Populus x berolinensis]
MTAYSLLLWLHDMQRRQSKDSRPRKEVDEGRWGSAGEECKRG